MVDLEYNYKFNLIQFGVGVVTFLLKIINTYL